MLMHAFCLAVFTLNELKEIAENSLMLTLMIKLVSKERKKHRRPVIIRDVFFLLLKISNIAKWGKITISEGTKNVFFFDGGRQSKKKKFI